MRFVRFPQGDDEVLIDSEKISFVSKRKQHNGKTIIYVIFDGTPESLDFYGKDAEIVWDYFAEHFNN